jgi:hypothetical protein
MMSGIQNTPSGAKVTGLIVSTATTANSCQKPPRRPWRITWRILACDAAFSLERAGRGLFRVEGYDRHGFPTKVRVNFWHTMALPLCCIFLAALPFLALWAAIVPVLRRHDRRAAMRHNTEMLRNRS